MTVTLVFVVPMFGPCVLAPDRWLPNSIQVDFKLFKLKGRGFKFKSQLQINLKRGGIRVSEAIFPSRRLSRVKCRKAGFRR
jgi:hypothetical protein